MIVSEGIIKKSPKTVAKNENYDPRKPTELIKQ
jgi:hypothetical protein